VAGEGNGSSAGLYKPRRSAEEALRAAEKKNKATDYLVEILKRISLTLNIL